MISQFVEQMEILMQIQRVKITQAKCSHHKYIWLCSKKIPSEFLSFRNEHKIRQALSKITAEEQIEVLRKLTKWLTDHPDIGAEKVPELALEMVNRAGSASLLREANLRRTSLFRSSLRRLSNRFSGVRSVSFKEQPYELKRNLNARGVAKCTSQNRSKNNETRHFVTPRTYEFLLGSRQK